MHSPQRSVPPQPSMVTPQLSPWDSHVMGWQLERREAFSGSSWDETVVLQATIHRAKRHPPQKPLPPRRMPSPPSPVRNLGSGVFRWKGTSLAGATFQHLPRPLEWLQRCFSVAYLVHRPSGGQGAG
jgi:hypothetical protein